MELKKKALILFPVFVLAVQSGTRIQVQATEEPTGGALTGIQVIDGEFCYYSMEGVYEEEKTNELREAAQEESDITPLLELIGEPMEKEYFGQGCWFGESGEESGEDGAWYYEDYVIYVYETEDVTYYMGAGALTGEKTDFQNMVEEIVREETAAVSSPEAKLKKLFQYVEEEYSYARKIGFEDYSGWQEEYALEMLMDMAGSCYHYASLYGFLAKEATGYEVRICVGSTDGFASSSWQKHAWTEIEIDGEWYVFDTNMDKYGADSSLQYYRINTDSKLYDELYRSDETYEVSFGTESSEENEAETGPEAESETETRTEIDTETETGTEAESETGVEAEIETESETGVETEVETETEAETGAETESGIGAETEIETESETGVETEVETETEAETGAETESGIGAETEIKTENETEVETETETENETGTETEIETENEAGVETEVETETEAETEKEVDTETESETETGEEEESDTETETGAETETENEIEEATDRETETETETETEARMTTEVEVTEEGEYVLTLDNLSELTFTQARLTDDEMTLTDGDGTEHLFLEVDKNDIKAPHLLMYGNFLAVKYTSASSGKTARLVEEGEEITFEEPQIMNVTGSVYVRSGAGLDYDTMSVAERGSEIKVIGETGKWYKISLSDGREGYVSKVCVIVEPETEAPAQGASQEQPQTESETEPEPEIVIVERKGKYYRYERFSPAEDTIVKIGRKLCYVEAGGTVSEGWKVLDGELYYSDAEGQVKCSETYEGITFKNDGAAVNDANARLKIKAMQIVASVTDDTMTQRQKLSACWSYVTGGHISYAGKYPDLSVSGWQRTMALDVLASGRGNCYGFACAFAALADEIGYDPVVVCGRVSGSRDGAADGMTRHSWVIINGYHYDPEAQWAGWCPGIYGYGSYPVTHTVQNTVAF